MEVSCRQCTLLADTLCIDYAVANTPIRVSPTMLLFPKPSALKDIYWDPKCNEKPTTYGSGALGPPQYAVLHGLIIWISLMYQTSLFTTLDSQTHKALRKALAVGAPWSIGQLKNEWEPRFDDQLITYTRNLQEKARKNETVCLSDKVAQVPLLSISWLPSNNKI